MQSSHVENRVTSQYTLQRVAVLGSGTMGPGVAVAFAAAGHEVSVWGRSTNRLRGSMITIEQMASFLSEHDLAEPAATVVSRVSAVEAFEDAVATTEVVIEAIVEDLGTKQRIFGRLDELCSPEVLLATNTSGLRVSDIADGLSAPQRVVAMHFWNPAHLMPIVEVVGGSKTSTDTVKRAEALVSGIGKVPVVLQKEVLGFLGTRMQQAVVREAIGLLDAGVASARDIDLAVRTSFGVRFPAIGALEAADLSGLDVIEAIHSYLLPDLDRSTSPQDGLRERVARGELGVKSGRGFHEWKDDQSRAVIERRDLELVRRLKLMAAERDATSTSDIDV